MGLIITPEFFSDYLAICLEGLLYGLYCGIFAMYLQYHASIEGTKNMLPFYPLCVLYLLSTGLIVFDIVLSLVTGLGLLNVGSTVIYRLTIVEDTLFGCCDFIAQSILIYRCWIVWRQNIRVVIIPSILAIAFLATWIANITAVSIDQRQITITNWGDTLIITGLVISMTVNALVTGLIVFRIFKVFQEVKAASDKVLLSVTGGSKLRSIIFIIIESGMALLSIQLTGLVITIFISVDSFQVIGVIHQMFNGITPTIILVRVSMGLSFHDEASMVEATGTFLHFTPDNSNTIPGKGSISDDGSVCFTPDHLNPLDSLDLDNSEDEKYQLGDPEEGR